MEATLTSLLSFLVISYPFLWANDGRESRLNFMTIDKRNNVTMIVFKACNVENTKFNPLWLSLTA